MAAEAVHGDRTSFSVEGAYEAEDQEANETLIRLTSGYSRDQRADLNQWPLALATTTGGVPLGLPLLEGNARDQTTLAELLAEVVSQFRAEREEQPIDVAERAGSRPGHDDRAGSEERLVGGPGARTLDAGQSAGGRGTSDLARH